VDLEAFYFSTGHRKWFFGLLIGVWVTLETGNQLRLETGSAIQRLDFALQMVIMIALTAVPIVTDRRWVHWVVVVILGGAIGAVAVRDILL
jgi:hypothetical protein